MFCSLKVLGNDAHTLREMFTRIHKVIILKSVWQLLQEAPVNVSIPLLQGNITFKITYVSTLVQLPSLAVLCSFGYGSFNNMNNDK